MKLCVVYTGVGGWEKQPNDFERDELEMRSHSLVQARYVCTWNGHVSPPEGFCPIHGSLSLRVVSKSLSMMIKNLGGHLCTEAAQSTLGYPTETVEKNLLLG